MSIEKPKKINAPRDNRGRLKKGSNLAAKRTPPDIKIMRDVCRDKLTEMAYRVATESRDEFQSRVKQADKSTALETFTSIALSKNNSKFVTWLFDQAVGRPRQVDIDNAQRPIEIKLSYDPSGQAVAIIPKEEIQQ